MTTLAELNDAIVDLRDAVYARLHDRMTLLVRMRIGQCHLRAAAQADRTHPDGGMARDSAAYGPIAAKLRAATAGVAVPSADDEPAMLTMTGTVSNAVEQVEKLP